MKAFEFEEGVTSDVTFIAYGKSFRELFENAAVALFSVICDIKHVKKEKKINVSVRGNGYRDLLFNWLQELIALVDTEEIFLSSFEIRRINENLVEATCYGEDASREKSGTVVKAVTYHNFNVWEDGKIKKARVTLDI